MILLANFIKLYDQCIHANYARRNSGFVPGPFHKGGLPLLIDISWEIVFNQFHFFRSQCHVLLHIPRDPRCNAPDNKVHGANMEPTWGRQDPGGPLVGHVNLAICGNVHNFSAIILSSISLIVKGKIQATYHIFLNWLHLVMSTLLVLRILKTTVLSMLFCKLFIVFWDPLPKNVYK